MQSFKRWTVQSQWIQFHEGLVGLLAAAVLGLVLIGALSMLLLPKWGEKDVPTNGVITGFVQTEGKFGSRRSAVVSIADGRTAMIGLPNPSSCQVGSRIAVAKRKTWWGSIYVAGLGYGCAP